MTARTYPGRRYLVTVTVFCCSVFPSSVSLPSTDSVSSQHKDAPLHSQSTLGEQLAGVSTGLTNTYPHLEKKLSKLLK